MKKNILTYDEFLNESLNVPKLDNEVIEKLHFRANQEELSGRIYFAMHQWLKFNGFQGAAALYKEYANEEFEHARMTYDYLQSFSIMPRVMAIEEPKNNFTGLPEILELSLAHEKLVLEQCEDLAKITTSLGDFKTYGLAQQFVNEQVDEIDKTSSLMDELETFGSSPESLRLLDTKMGMLAAAE